MRMRHTLRYVKVIGCELSQESVSVLSSWRYECPGNVQYNSREDPGSGPEYCLEQLQKHDHVCKYCFFPYQCVKLRNSEVSVLFSGT